MLTGNVMITGGSGFIARALYLRAREENWPVQFTAISRDDHKHARLRPRFPEVHFAAMDVRTDIVRLSSAFRGHDLVIHAAASKHVDLAEFAAFETVEVNVEGSRNVAMAAIVAGVPRVVGISTDKAAAPENVYGKTKALMESLFQEADRMSDTTFTVVRYGNVIGSTGSVVPKFRESLAKGEQVHLTDPDMTRFWMGHGEAVDTIQYGVNVARPGSIAIPLPRAMRLHDLALVALGIEERQPLPEGRFIIDGIRPGEKKHESLIAQGESYRAVPPADGTNWRARHYEIRPPGEFVNRQPFVVASNDPPAGWIGPREMARLMSEAEGV